MSDGWDDEPADAESPHPASGGKKGQGGKTQARRQALQALYQWDLGGGYVHEIVRQFAERQGVAAGGYFEQLLRGVAENTAELDVQLEKHIDRQVVQLDPIERCVLRLAAFELQQSLDVPYRVVINEAVEMAKSFGAEGGHKYVNGVADKLARSLRSAEFGKSKRR